jgi:fatty-acyl-CoA synthase
MLYTGGTTGLPKGVVSRTGPHVASIIAAVAPLLGVDPSVDIEQVPAIAARTVADQAQIVSLPACPLMHGTGLGIGVIPPMAYGGCVVLLTGRRFEADELWSTVAAERVTWTVIVGDPFARPMWHSLRTAQADGRPYDTSSLRVIGSSGATFSAEVRTGLLELLPAILILDYISSSEGQMGLAVSAAGHVVPTASFTPSDGVKVFTEDDRPVEPGSGERGLVALSVGVPEGYFGDEAKSAATFRVVDGVRYSFPGDWATVAADGTIALLGRGSQCITTGGEKVFPQEVEEAIKCHAAVEDCLVFGRPDERFGQRVTAIVSLVSGVAADPAEMMAEMMAEAGRRLSSYKLPRDMAVVAVVPRAANGKADYPAARALYEETAEADPRR